jgi:alpha-galactosidase
LFNLGDQPTKIVANFSDLGVSGKQIVRDLWRQSDVGEFGSKYEATVAPHGVVLVKLSAAK